MHELLHRLRTGIRIMREREGTEGSGVRRRERRLADTRPKGGYQLVDDIASVALIVDTYIADNSVPRMLATM